jgi:hypothetical protein
MSILNSFEYFADHLKGPDRDKLLFIAGSLSPFDDLFDTHMVFNQIGAKEYDPQKPQSIFYGLSGENNDPDCGVSFIISPDESILVQSTRLWIKARETEEYEMSLDDLHNWLKAQPPKWQRFAK